MTGLTQEQVTWLYEQLEAIVVWEAPTGRPHVLPLHTALVVVLFGLRHNLPDDVIGELFDCSGSTVTRYQDDLEPLIDILLTPLYEEIRAQAHRAAALVDGFVVPVGERDGVAGLHSGKKHVTGINVHAVSTLSGRLADVGEPCPGSRHDSRAFAESGIAERWKAHYTPGGLGMLGDKGYVGTGVTTPTRKPIGRDLTDVQRACNTAINRLRAAVERAIAHVKSWKILKPATAGHSTSSPPVLLTVAKLEIFRVYGLF